MPIDRRLFLHPAVVALTYFAAAAATIAHTRLGGGVAMIWIATAVLLTHLSLVPRRRWPAALIGCAAMSIIATAAFGVGIEAAPFLAAINVGEAALAAWLLRKRLRNARYFESVDNLIGFVTIAGLLVPAITAVPGALTVALATGTPFLSNLSGWFAGHALGTIALSPILMLLMRGEIADFARAAPRRQRIEAAALLGLVAGACFLTFRQSVLPLLFLPTLPMLVASFRLGRLGAATSLMILLLVSAFATAAGTGPLALVPGEAVFRVQFYQFYLAVMVLTMLPAAALLKERKAMIGRVLESEARYRLLAEHSSDAIFSVTVDGIIRYASPAVAALVGRSPQEVQGRHALSLIYPEDRPVVEAMHRRALERLGETVTSEHRARGPDGALHWFECHTRAVIGPGGRPTGMVTSVRDVSERKSVEQSLSLAASTDPLTGLANRRTLLDRLDRRLAQASTRPICVAMLDLDHFKRINDRYGHAAGDAVLQGVADVARRVLREADVIARLGGEEFAILLDGADLPEAERTCERLRAAIAFARVDFAGARIAVSASIGIARVAPGTGRDALLLAADAALYEAKAAGRNRLSIAA